MALEITHLFEDSTFSTKIIKIRLRMLQNRNILNHIDNDFLQMVPFISSRIFYYSSKKECDDRYYRIKESYRDILGKVHSYILLTCRFFGVFTPREYMRYWLRLDLFIKASRRTGSVWRSIKNI